MAFFTTDEDFKIHIGANCGGILVVVGNEYLSRN
jgi:hypothetical protein